MRAHSRVAWQQLEGRVVLLDLERGRALGLNETGSFLWTRLDDGSEDALAAELAASFRIERSQARLDVAGFIQELDQRGFLERE